VNLDWLSAAVLISIVCFISIRWTWLRKKDKLFSRGEAAKMAILAAGFPSAVIVCVTPFNKSLLAQIVDKPAYLLPMGVIMVMYSIGDLFDWDA
jgi:hypothetical protein